MAFCPLSPIRANFIASVHGSGSPGPFEKTIPEAPRVLISANFVPEPTIFTLQPNPVRVLTIFRLTPRS